MYKELFEKAVKIIVDSKIDNKKDLMDFINIMQEEDLNIFVDLMSSNPQFLEIIANNIKNKKSITDFGGNDWKNILAEEEQIIVDIKK